VTPTEKVFEIFSMIFFKVYLAFVAAEITTLFSNQYTQMWDYFEKLNIIEEWLKHTKMPETIIYRTRKYYQGMWERNKGVKDENIIASLPYAIQNEMVFCLYKG